MIKKIIAKVVDSKPLERDEACAAMNFIMDGDATPAQIAALMIALKIKGETVDEIAGFVEAMRSHMVKINLNDTNAVDGVGTGGDGAHSFNISTAAAIVASAAGVTVAKHGNRSVSSKCGSADLLEATGAKIDSGPDNVQDSINQLGFGFMFAPIFHAAMKHAVAPRRELGLRTAFNILGPMTNPAGVKRQVTGVYSAELMPLMADVLKATGSEHVLVLHSRDGLDEFSVSDLTDYIELKAGQTNRLSIGPEEIGLKLWPHGSLGGGDASENIKILHRVLEGEKSAYRDAVLFNAAAMVYVASKAQSIADGITFVSQAIDSGAAKAKLKAWVDFTHSGQ